MNEENKNTQNDDVVIDTSEFDSRSKKAVENTDDLDDSVVAEESAKATVADLRAKIKTLTSEKQEYLDGWQRAKADFVNFKKRSEEERKEVVKFANESLLEELLPVLDSFTMAFANKEVWEKVDKNWRAGVEYIHTQLVGILTSNGIKELNPQGEKFDPMRDEVLEFVPVESEDKNNLIISVVSKGYSLNGKVVKAPKVKVGEVK